VGGCAFGVATRARLSESALFLKRDSVAAAVVVVEKASIDEAFIDFTRPVRAELIARYPYLAEVPPEAPNGLDTALPPPPPIAWAGRGILIPINPDAPPPAEDQARSESGPADGAGGGTMTEVGDGGEGDDDSGLTWHDVALSIAAELMDRIRAEVRTQLGYTTSAVGISRIAIFSCSSVSDDSRSIPLPPGLARPSSPLAPTHVGDRAKQVFGQGAFDRSASHYDESSCAPSR